MREKKQNEDIWIQQIFEAAQASSGGVVRRSCKSVEKYASYAKLKAAADDRGFRVVRVGEQYVISCKRELVLDVK